MRYCHDQVLCAQDRDAPQILSSSYCASTDITPEPASIVCSGSGTMIMVLANTPPTYVLCVSPFAAVSLVSLRLS